MFPTFVSFTVVMIVGLRYVTILCLYIVSTCIVLGGLVFGSNAIFLSPRELVAICVTV